jgi:hypothetical protein
MISESQIQVVVDERSLELHPNGSITGIVYFCLDSTVFPDKRWNDFIVIVLSWWVQATKRLSRAENAVETFSFMDGPFEIIVDRKNTLVSLSLVTRRGRGKSIGPFYTSFRSLSDALNKAANQILTSCAKRDIHSNQLAELERAVDEYHDPAAEPRQQK